METTPVDDVFDDSHMECGIELLAPSLIALVTGTLEQPIVAAPDIGRALSSGTLRVDSAVWRSTSPEPLSVAKLTDPIATGNSYPFVVFGDETMLARLRTLVDDATHNGAVLVVGLSETAADGPGLRLYGTVSTDGFESPSGCDEIRTAQLHNIVAATGTTSLATALGLLADEVQWHGSVRPGPIEQSAYGNDEDSQPASSTAHSTPDSTESRTPESPPLMTVNAPIVPGERFQVWFAGELRDVRGGYLWVQQRDGTVVALLRSDGNTEIPMGYELDLDNAAILDDGLSGDMSRFVVPPELPPGDYDLCTANSIPAACITVRVTTP